MSKHRSSKARLVITAITLENRSVVEVCTAYGVSRSWAYELLARYRTEGEAAFEPRSRRPKNTPKSTPPAVASLILLIREQLSEKGLDGGADTIGWHLRHHHQVTVSRATIHRILVRAGAVVAQPKKRPKSSLTRFEATMPNQTWQSDFTHYRLSTGVDVEIITWLDDCTRYALHISAHARITTDIVRATFRKAAGQHGLPASTLTDNGMVYTVRFSGGRGGRNAFEQELRDRHVVQKNSSPSHPQTCGKVERFQQTMKNWLAAQPVQPNSVTELQTLLDTFTTIYNTERPHRSLPHRATPATLYESMPKAVPGEVTDPTSHDRIRHDIVDKVGTVTLRHRSRLHHIGIGRTYAGTCIILIVQDLDIRVVNAATGELLRELTLDPNRDYQPTRAPKGPTRRPPK
jgi:transposase InsO family protein